MHNVGPPSDRSLMHTATTIIGVAVRPEVVDIVRKYIEAKKNDMEFSRRLEQLTVHYGTLRQAHEVMASDRAADREGTTIIAKMLVECGQAAEAVTLMKEFLARAPNYAADVLHVIDKGGE